MFPLLVATVAAMLFAWGAALTVPAEQAKVQAVAADVAAANFWSYQRAVGAFVFTNPGFAGTVSDASLTFELGHVRNTSWTNVVANGQLYTYSNAPVPSGALEAIAAYGGRTLMIGRAQAGNTMTSLTGGAAGFPLPAAIPAGAIVVIGS